MGHRPKEENMAVRKTPLQNAGGYRIIQWNANFLQNSNKKKFWRMYHMLLEKIYTISTGLEVSPVSIFTNSWFITRILEIIIS